MQMRINVTYSHAYMGGGRENQSSGQAGLATDDVALNLQCVAKSSTKMITSA